MGWSHALGVAIVVAIACGCGPQVAVDDEVDGTSGGVREDAGSGSASGAGGRPGSGGTGDPRCDRESCPRCEDGCVREIACGPDGVAECSCICGADSDTGSVPPPPMTDAGDVGETTSAGEGTSDGGEASSDGGEDTSSCPVGSQGCPCGPDGACNPGFLCDSNQNVCVLDACPVGTEGCPCTGGGACDPGLLCLDDTCTIADD